MTTIAKLFALLFMCLLSSAISAHQSSTAYFTGVASETGRIDAQWQVRLYDLHRAVGVDVDGDGSLLWGELLAREAQVSQYLRQNVTIERGGNLCPLAIDSAWQITEHFNEGYLVVPVRAQCALEGQLILRYEGLFDRDSDHKMILSLKNMDERSKQTGTTHRILSDQQRQVTVDGAAGSLTATAWEFIEQGAIHIWKGLDHILFLCSLLLTCVLVRQNGRWVGKSSAKEIASSAAWIVTAFTLAHSVTLTATAMGLLDLPTRWVEVGIALSVAVAALNNIFPLVSRLGWMTFAFGLLHGMGFAGVLGELGLPADQRPLAVLSFNLGVEFGQLAILLGVLPVLILVRKRDWYSRYFLVLASMAVVVVAGYWVVQRL